MEPWDCCRGHSPDLTVKTRVLKGVVVSLGGLAACITIGVLLSDNNRPDSFNTLSGNSVLELPPMAAFMVSHAPTNERSAVAREVVQKVATLAKPGVIPFTVNAICETTPEVTAEVVSTAAALEPQDSLFIAKAALTAAPAKTGIIVESVCRQVPQAYAWVAVIADEVNTTARPQILQGITNALPVLASPVERAQAYCENRPMLEVMQKAHELATEAYQTELARMKRETIETILQNQEEALSSNSTSEVTFSSAAVQEAVNMHGSVGQRLAALDRGVTKTMKENGLLPSRMGDMTYLQFRPAPQASLKASP
jgi:hypothetical protein